jgi:hypothetical protein
MPLNARRHIRKMRGGAQSHLIETDDGRFYVVKFQNNPQHRRILVNELIAGVFLRHLQIASPDTAIVRLSEDFLRDNPEVSIQLGVRKLPVAAGWHFGSGFPGDPAKLAVYDFIPDVLLGQVTNLPDFLGVLVFDKWTANADGRQAIFFRARLREWTRAAEFHPLRVGFVAQMIDHGFLFDGPHWDFPDSPVQGLYARRLVYEKVRSLDDFQPWLDQVTHFPEEIVDQAYRQIPPEWIDGEEDSLERALEQLLRRRKRVPDLIKESRQAQRNPFPNWR